MSKTFGTSYLHPRPYAAPAVKSAFTFLTTWLGNQPLALGKYGRLAALAIAEAHYLNSTFSANDYIFIGTPKRRTNHGEAE